MTARQISPGRDSPGATRSLAYRSTVCVPGDVRAQVVARAGAGGEENTRVAGKELRPAMRRVLAGSTLSKGSDDAAGDRRPQQSGREGRPNGANTIVPSSFHAAPRPLGASHSVTTGPPVTAIFLSLPPEKNPIQLPLRRWRFRAIGSRQGAPRSARRVSGRRSEDVHRRASARQMRPAPPSGDSAIASPRSKDRKASAPTWASRRLTGAAGGRVLFHGHDTPPTIAAAASTPVTNQVSAPAGLARDAADLLLGGSPAGGVSVSSISSRASAASASRRVRSFSRQRQSRRRIGVGVLTGSDVQFGSPRSTAAIVSDASSPRMPARR